MICLSVDFHNAHIERRGNIRNYGLAAVEHLGGKNLSAIFGHEHKMGGEFEVNRPGFPAGALFAAAIPIGSCP